MRRLLALVAAGTVLAVAAPALAHDPAAHHDHAAGAEETGPIPGLPGFGGPFSLLDQTGRRRTDADFHGKLMLVTFGYTNCPDICRLDLQKVAAALDQVGPTVAGHVAPLFISVDAEHDTPATLAAFVTPFSPAIIGLSGSPQEIASVTANYRVHALVGADGAIEHSDFEYLMGPDGKFLTLVRPDATAETIAGLLTKYDRTNIAAAAN